MIKKTTTTALLALLAACSGTEEDGNETKPTPPSTAAASFTVKSSISSNPDPEARKAENQAVMDHMYEDDAVPADLLRGEAFRRGVPLDEAKLQAKIERQKTGAAIAPPSGQSAR